MNQEPVLRMEAIRKAFPGVLALQDVDFNVHPGEIVGLVGENGAGKSTLFKILTGVYRKDSGNMVLGGREIEPLSPREAFDLGISVIHQELHLVPQMMVYENVFLGREQRCRGLRGRYARSLDKKDMQVETQRLLDELGAQFAPTAVVKELGVAQQQLVEIAKALSLDARIIIMDEPTSTLPQTDVEALFDVMRKLRNQGRSIVFITHRLEEVLAIVDRIVVLRDGQNAGEMPIEEATQQRVISLVVGRTMDQLFPKEPAEIGDVVLSVKGLTRGRLVRDVSFELHRGEILGFAGLVGAGRTETMRALFGIDQKDAGEIYLDGKQLKLETPRASVHAGLGFVPEDRKQHGLILGMAVYENISLPSLGQISGPLTMVINKTSERSLAVEYVDQLRIRTPSIRQLAKNLSGGNQQKTVLAKWLATRPKILIMDEPTRGIDVGAKAEIHALMSRFAQAGVGVILVSSELPEILGMCDRILVMCKGAVTGEFTRAEADQEKIMERCCL